MSRILRLHVDNIKPDRVQYKPYLSELSCPELFVEVTVDDENVIEFNEEEKVVTPDGLAEIMNQIATAIKQMDNEYRQNL